MMLRHAPSTATADRSDTELVAGCRAGDAGAWECLVRRYQRLIYTVPMRLGLSEDEAGDIFQQTCLRLFQRLDTIQNPERIDAWLVSTARRLTLDLIARRRGEQPADEETAALASDDAPADEHLAALEEQQRIRQAVERLDPRCRALVYHLFYDAAAPSYQHIAASLGMPLGSIGPVRARCFSRLKALLEAE